MIENAFEASYIEPSRLFGALYEPYETYVQPSFKISKREFMRAIDELVALGVLKRGPHHSVYIARMK